jgi:hypothetical protein
MADGYCTPKRGSAVAMRTPAWRCKCARCDQEPSSGTGQYEGLDHVARGAVAALRLLTNRFSGLYFCCLPACFASQRKRRRRPCTRPMARSKGSTLQSASPFFRILPHYAAVFTCSLYAHELTGRALRRGQVRYHRAASILHRWAAQRCGSLGSTFANA